MRKICNKGHRIRASDKQLVYHFSIGTLLFVFVAVLLLLNTKQLMRTDWEHFSLLENGLTLSPYNFITILIATGVCALVAFLYYRFCYDSFKKLLHRQKLAKPYDTLILLEKIKRALQLSNPSNFRELVKKDCTLDLHLSILKYQEQSIELTRNEFRILYYFFMNEDKVISKEELLEKLWNDKYYIDENVLLVNMTRLKKKMKEIGIVHLLENIRGKGWKL